MPGESSSFSRQEPPSRLQILFWPGVRYIYYYYDYDLIRFIKSETTHWKYIFTYIYIYIYTYIHIYSVISFWLLSGYLAVRILNS